MFVCEWRAAVGSPPRVRGKVDYTENAGDYSGITPACAGKRCCGVVYILHAGDHPRVCGEKRERAALAVDKVGSPPRVRGKVPEILDQRIPSGITPACAGKRTFASDGQEHT